MVGAVGADVLLGEPRLAGQVARHHAVQSPGAPRGRDVMRELRRFLRQLVGCDDEALDNRGIEADAEERHADIERRPRASVSRAQARRRGLPTGRSTAPTSAATPTSTQADQRAVQIGETRSHERPGGRVQQTREPDELNAQCGDDEQRAIENRDVQLRRRLDGDVPPVHHHVTAQRHTTAPPPQD